MAREKLYKPNSQISSEEPKSVESVAVGSPNKGLLLRIMADSYSSDRIIAGESDGYTTRYEETEEGRVLQFEDVSSNEMADLLTSFRENPKLALATVRINLVNLVRDETIPENKRKERLGRYLEAYLAIIPKLDQYTFPHDEESRVMEGVPSYIPDGLSDMGGHSEVSEGLRFREKIRVDKEKSYAKAYDSLFDAFWNLRLSKIDPSSLKAKGYLVVHTAVNVYQAMKYDYKDEASYPKGGSIRADHFVDSKKPMSVCRHIAMESQLRFQALGLESRLLKCDMDGDPHAANLVRLEGQWYLLDVTNPELDPDNPTQGKVYRRPITLTDEPNQTWVLDRYAKDKDGKVVKKTITYRSRNNMYYRIMSNKEKPAA